MAEQKELRDLTRENCRVEQERRLTIIEEDIQDLCKKIDSLEASVADLVYAWKTASGVVSFVKWVASITTAIVALVAFVKLGWFKI